MSLLEKILTLLMLFAGVASGDPDAIYKFHNTHVMIYEGAQVRPTRVEVAVSSNASNCFATASLYTDSGDTTFLSNGYASCDDAVEDIRRQLQDYKDSQVQP